MSMIKAPVVCNANNLTHRINRRLRDKWRKNILWIEAARETSAAKLVHAEAKLVEAKAASAKEPEDDGLRDNLRMAKTRVNRLTAAPSQHDGLLTILKRKLADNPSLATVSTVR